MKADLSLLSLPRFSQPDGWNWQKFTSSSGHTIRFGSVFPKNDAKAVVICLPGFREFGEKYFELSHDMLSRDYAFFVIDWLGQGGSDHLLEDPHKVHSLGFEQNVKDLNQLIEDHIKPGTPNLSAVFLGHSMGGHLGLRYLHGHQDDYIKAAAFSAPLINIIQFASYPSWLVNAVCAVMQFKGSAYIPGGATVADLKRALGPGQGDYSSDPLRDQIHYLWYDKSADLQVKGPTYAWLYQMAKSCAVLHNSDYLSKIKTPVMIGIAGQDKIVSSNSTRKLCARLPKGEIVEFPTAKHEILMEKDEIRDNFLSGFDDFMQKHVFSPVN